MGARTWKRCINLRASPTLSWRCACYTAVGAKYQIVLLATLRNEGWEGKPGTAQHGASLSRNGEERGGRTGF